MTVHFETQRIAMGFWAHAIGPWSAKDKTAHCDRADVTCFAGGDVGPQECRGKTRGEGAHLDFLKSEK